MGSLLIIEMARQHQADLLAEAGHARLVREARTGRPAPAASIRLIRPGRVIAAAAGALAIVVGVVDGLPR